MIEITICYESCSLSQLFHAPRADLGMGLADTDAFAVVPAPGAFLTCGLLCLDAKIAEILALHIGALTLYNLYPRADENIFQERLHVFHEG